MRKLLIVFLAFLSLSASAQVAGNKQIVAQNLAELKTKLGFKGQYVQLLGNTTINDGGQRMYAWDSINTQANDDVQTVQVTGVITGRWKLVVDDQVYRASWWGLASGGGDQSAKINAMFLAVPMGSTIVFDYDKTYYISSKIVIPQPLTIKANGSSFTYSGAATNVVSIQSSNVTIDGLEVNGTYATHTTSKELIGTEGNSNTSFYNNIVIKNCVLHDYIDAGIRLQYVRNFEISGNSIYKFPYGGIIVFSGINGKIKDNEVTDITSLGTTGSNAYGIEVIRQVSITTDSVPYDISIQNNVIRRVLLWEGIDTHGGQKLSITNNRVYNCNKGIAMVATGSATQKDINIIGNITDNDSLGTGADAGIAVEGLSTIYATGINIIGNTCIGGNGGIKVQYGKGVNIQGNTVKKTIGGYGVQFDAPNLQCSVIGNSFLDIMGTGNTAAIKTTGTSGTEVYIHNNSLSDDGAALPASGNKNRYGFRANTTTQTGDLVYIGKNNFAAATVAQYGNINYTRFFTDEASKPTRITTLSFTVTATDNNIIYDYAAGGGTATLPALGALTDGREIYISNTSTGTLTLSIAVYTNNTTSTTSIPAGAVYRLVYDNASGKIWKF